MKILKIELQNINSLKSSQKIVIDFESGYFKDVGLYAITGSTGSGKTTILDAITIALYHKVPRFNNAKNKLDQVVSFGASTAFSHVLFENNNEIFEANWSIRKISKSGKILTNSQEEFRLINITTNKIIAEGKKEVEAKVIEVTQLNYNQFLRSMMLAQGEFAAFLSASAKDKGTLLEQITGEEIYKRIGEIIQNKLRDEKKKLDKISHKLSDAILTDDAKEENLELQTKYKLEVLKINNELANFKKIEDWYTHQSQLEQDIVNLEKETNILTVKQAKEKENIKQLEEHLKAEPYKENIDTYKRVSIEIETLKKNQKDLSLTLENVIANLKKVKDEEQKSLDRFNKIEVNFQKWLPLFDVITTLDNSITKDTIQLNSELKTITELEARIGQLTSKQFKNSKLLKVLEENITQIDKNLEQAKGTEKIAKRLTDWTTELKLIGYNYKQLITFKDFIVERQSVLDHLAKDKKSQQEVITKVNLELDLIDKQIQKNVDDSKALDFEVLLNEKEKLNTQLLVNNQLIDLTNEIQLKKSEKKINDKASLIKTEELGVYQNRLEVLKETQKTLKILVDDAFEILKLNQTIKSLEAERKKLKEGEACQLCGSTDHPLIEHYQSLNFSKTEVELHNRQQELEKNIKEHTAIEKSIEALKIELEFISKNNKNAEATICKLSEKIKALSFSSYKSVLDIKNFSKDIQIIELKLKKSKQLTLKKEKLTNAYNLLNNKLNKESQKNIQIKEKEKHYQEELNKKQIEKTNLEKSNSTIINLLEKEFEQYELKMPRFGDYQLFINQLNKKVDDFKALEISKQDLIKRKEELIQSLKHIKETNSQLHELLNKHNQQKDKLELAIKVDKIKRLDLLPLKISVTEKQKELQAQKEKAQKEHQKLKLELDNLTNQKIKVTAELNTIVNKLKEVKDVFIETEKLLKANVLKSNFETIESIEIALLSVTKKNELTQLKTDLNNESIRLKALKTKIDQNQTKQLKSKTFRLDEQQVKKALIQFNLDKEAILKSLGELNQKLITNTENEEKNKAVVLEMELQNKIIHKWDVLLKLLGGSKDSFNTYVQRLTLQNLISLANIHLNSLNKRYSLRLNEEYKTGEELNFKLIDHFQTDKARNIDTSSGGEKFIISLALALGLSDLSSSNVKIQSLFIDEGFGTLDNATLETVISTLETLQAQGKKIGVISHVESLKERISTQIQITKKSNGVSELQIVQN